MRWLHVNFLSFSAVLYSLDLQIITESAFDNAQKSCEKVQRNDLNYGLVSFILWANLTCLGV